MHRPPDDNRAYADMAIRALLYEARLRGMRPTPARTHAEVLRDELDARGRVSYRELMDLYAPKGYTRGGFGIAVKRLRAAGLIEAARVDGVIVRAGRCPCCGRAMGD